LDLLASAAPRRQGVWVVRIGVRLGLWLGLAVGFSSAGLGEMVGGPAGPTGGTYTGELPAPAPGPNVTVISAVPAYTWYHGCGPTSLGMIVGYYDGNGFPNMIPGSNDWSTSRQAIEDVIASAGHIRDYVPTPDRTPTAADPYHADDSLADFCGSSRHPLQYGWSYFSKQDNGLRGWASSRGYMSATDQDTYANMPVLWNSFVGAIGAGMPAQLLVDTNANNGTDHFVTAVGYDDTPGGRKYAAYVTWDTDLHWFEFEAMRSGQYWGIYGATYFHPMPEPSSVALMLLGLLAATRRRRSRGVAGPRRT